MKATIEQTGYEDYEVIAPEGYCFERDLHVLVASSRKEAEIDRDMYPLQECPNDCMCKE